jgi:hypothetical protein
VPASSLGEDFPLPTEEHHCPHILSTSIQAQYIAIHQYRFLAHAFKCIIDNPSYHSTISSVDTGSVSVSLLVAKGRFQLLPLYKA